MSVRVWLADDIRDMLESQVKAALLLPSGEFQNGMLAELSIIATAFGVDDMLTIGDRRDTGQASKRFVYGLSLPLQP